MHAPRSSFPCRRYRKPKHVACLTTIATQLSNAYGPHPMTTVEIDLRARSFAEAATAFLVLVEGLNLAQWHGRAADDRRTIGTIAHHVALGYAIGHWRIVAAASGYPQPLQQGTAEER